MIRLNFLLDKIAKHMKYVLDKLTLFGRSLVALPCKFQHGMLGTRHGQSCCIGSFDVFLAARSPAGMPSTLAAIDVVGFVFAFA